MKDPDIVCHQGQCPCDYQTIHDNGTLLFSMREFRRRTDLNCHNDNGRTALLASILDSNIKEKDVLFDTLLDNQCIDLNMLDFGQESDSDYYKGGSALHNLILQKDVEKMEKLLNRLVHSNTNTKYEFQSSNK